MEHQEMAPSNGDSLILQNSSRVLEDIFTKEDADVLLDGETRFGIKSFDGTIFDEIAGDVIRDHDAVAQGALADIYTGTWIRPDQERVKVAIKVLRKVGMEEQDHPEKFKEAQLRANKRLNREVKVWQTVSHPHANNILINDDGHAVLGDFGVARVCMDLGIADATAPWNYGCLGFIAPECHDADDGAKEPPRDVYAFGGLIAEVYSRVPPYWHLRRAERKIVLAITVEGATSPREYHEGVPDWAWDLALRCWTSEPESRPPMTEVLAIVSPVTPLCHLATHSFLHYS
ncbi:hypothetical protein FRC02_009290 [Tulasnella sp. 418]|nr:hypothetical protein FRC02_009290 [Tulasnella sp. 418]